MFIIYSFSSISRYRNVCMFMIYRMYTYSNNDSRVSRYKSTCMFITHRMYRMYVCLSYIVSQTDIRMYVCLSYIVSQTDIRMYVCLCYIECIEDMYVCHAVSLEGIEMQV